MGLVSIEQAKTLLNLEESTLKRLKKEARIFGWNGKYDEQSLYNYQIMQDYAKENGKNSLIDTSKKRAPKMPKKRGKYKKVAA